MTPALVTTFANRIRRANRTMSVCGDMMLCFDFDGMSYAELIALRSKLATRTSPIRYAPLDRAIIDAARKTVAAGLALEARS